MSLKTGFSSFQLSIIFFTVAIEPDAWLKLLRKMELKPHPLVVELTNQTLSLVMDAMATRSDQSRACLRTLLRVSEDSVVGCVVDEVCRVLGAREVVSVTTDDMEIMLTPPTQLWHNQLWKE